MMSERTTVTTHGRRRPCHGAALLLLLLSASLACAQVELLSPEPLQIGVADQCIVTEWYSDPEIGAAEMWDVEAEGWEHVQHLWATGEGWKMRREIALRPDRLEITQLRFFETDATGVSSSGMLLPLDVLDGATFQCIGAPVGDVEHEGRVSTGTLGAGEVTRINNLEYLRLHLPGGAVDFDCNPKGTWCPSVGLCPATARFTLLRYNDAWRLWSADGKARRGTIHDFKLVITPALDVAVEDVHPTVNVRWTEPYSPTSLVNVGQSPVARFDATVQPGGQLTRDERFAGVRDERVEGASITGGTMVLGIPADRDGIYLVSLLAGDPEREIGPATIAAGVGEPVETPAVRAGDYGSWALPGRAVDGAIAVTITGNARIVAAAAAPMMFANEDYLLERGWWVSTDFHPDDDLPL